MSKIKIQHKYYSHHPRAFLVFFYLLVAPLDRNCLVDREIQFCCQSGSAQWRRSDIETRQSMVQRAQPNPQTHRTDQLDTLGTLL